VPDVERWADLRTDHFVRGVAIKELVRRTGELAWGKLFGDGMAATAMVDRLIHHAEILSFKGDSYRLKDRDLGPRASRQSAEIDWLTKSSQPTPARARGIQTPHPASNSA